MSDETPSTDSNTSGRISGVSAKILELLAGNPKSTAELVAEGGFSAAAAFLNLKKLKDSGAIDTDRQGRTVIYRLVDAAAASAGPASRKGRNASAAKSAASTGKRGRRPASPEAADGTLADELKSIAERFAPVDNLSAKLEALDQLAATMPTRLAALLRAIRSDLARLGA